MQARINNPAMILPDALPALQDLGKTIAASAKNGGPPARTLHLVYLRASQINGCSFCVDMHSREAKKGGEIDQRLFAVAAWRPSLTMPNAPHSRSPRPSLASTTAPIR